MEVLFSLIARFRSNLVIRRRKWWNEEGWTKRRNNSFPSLKLAQINRTVNRDVFSFFRSEVKLVCRDTKLSLIEHTSQLFRSSLFPLLCFHSPLFPAFRHFFTHSPAPSFIKCLWNKSLGIKRKKNWIRIEISLAFQPQLLSCHSRPLFNSIR